MKAKLIHTQPGLEAHVWPTLEVIVEEAPGHLQRHIDEETGLALIDLQ